MLPWQGLKPLPVSAMPITGPRERVVREARALDERLPQEEREARVAVAGEALGESAGGFVLLAGVAHHRPRKTGLRFSMKAVRPSA